MNPIRRKMAAFVTEAAYKEIEALEPESELAKELTRIGDVDKTISEEIKKLCDTVTLAETTKAFLLVRRLEKAPECEKEIIKTELNGIADELITRVETKSGRLTLSGAYRHLFSEL